MNNHNSKINVCVRDRVQKGIDNLLPCEQNWLDKLDDNKSEIFRRLYLKQNNKV